MIQSLIEIVPITDGVEIRRCMARSPQDPRPRTVTQEMLNRFLSLTTTWAKMMTTKPRRQRFADARRISLKQRHKKMWIFGGMFRRQSQVVQRPDVSGGGEGIYEDASFSFRADWNVHYQGKEFSTPTEERITSTREARRLANLSHKKIGTRNVSSFDASGEKRRRISSHAPSCFTKSQITPNL